MIDLGIMFISYLMLPISTVLNIILLFPVPQFLKRPLRAKASQILFKVQIFSLVLFGIYLYAYSTTIFHINDSDPVEYRLEARSAQWKMERNYHITFFNLVNWSVAAGTEYLLRKIDTKLEKKKGK